MGEGVLIYGLRDSRNRQEKLQRFVDGVLKDGKKRGKSFFVSNIPPNVFQDARKNGVNLVSDQIFLADGTVLKYPKHPKNKKGATLGFKEFWKLVNICSSPMNIYKDKTHNKLIYVFAGRGKKSRSVIKVIIEPNYKKNKKIVNMITSIGVVDKREMKHE